MAEYNSLNTLFVDICDALREKNESLGLIKHNEIAEIIRTLQNNINKQYIYALHNQQKLASEILANLNQDARFNSNMLFDLTGCFQCSGKVYDNSLGATVDCEDLIDVDTVSFNYKLTPSYLSYFLYGAPVKSVDLSNVDTSHVTNMKRMLSDCEKLTSLDISNFNTSNVTNMSRMFNGCSKLTTLDVSHFDTSKVIDMSSMFNTCSSLTTLDLSNFDTSNVTDMSGLFRYCDKLSSLDVSHFDTSKVTDMNRMFCRCKSLTSLDLSNFDTSNVTDMSDMFTTCTSLTTLDVSHFNTSKVTNMNRMFCNTSLVTLDMSNFDTRRVVDMCYMFLNCTSLQTIDLSNFVLLKARMFYGMFSGCSNLEKLKIGAMLEQFEYCETETTGVTTIRLFDLWTNPNIEIDFDGHSFALNQKRDLVLDLSQIWRDATDIQLASFDSFVNSLGANTSEYIRGIKIYSALYDALGSLSSQEIALMNKGYVLQRTT